MINGPVRIRIYTPRFFLARRLGTEDIEVGDGWLHILRDMIVNLDAIGTQIKCEGIHRSSTGEMVIWSWNVVGLQAADHRRAVRASEIVGGAIGRSTRTCELCSTNHQVERRLTGDGYVYRCAECWSRRLP